MKARLLAYVGGISQRTLLMVMGGIVVLMVLEGWLLLLKQPVNEYFQARRDRSALEAYLREPRQVPAEIERMEREIATLNGRLTGPGSDVTPDRMIVYLVGRLAEIAARHGTALHGVRPAGLKRVAMFDEMAFDVQTAGSYRSLLAWLEDVERELGPLVVAQFSIKRGAPGAPLGMDLRLAAYRLSDPGGGSK